MGTTDKYCLRWNDYRSNISLAFQDLRSSADFFDVTLATEEAEIRAHRVILSACSPHLRDVLKRHANSQQQNLLIYLRGVRQCDLEAILEFMYNGEVNVSQEDLNSFLAVAEDLKVKGLTQNTSGDSNANHTPISATSAASTTTTTMTETTQTVTSAATATNRTKGTLMPSGGGMAPKNGSNTLPSAVKRFKRDSSGVAKVKEESGSNQQVVITPDVSFEGGEDDGGDEVEEHDDDNIDEDGAGYDEEGEGYPYSAYESESNDALVDPSSMAVAGTSGIDGSKDFLDSPLVRSWVGRGPDGRRMCKLCGMTGGDATRIKNHIESVHWPHSQGYACEQCTAICKTRHALACHKSRHHPRRVRPEKESPKKSSKVIAPLAHIESAPLDLKQEPVDDPALPLKTEAVEASALPEPIIVSHTSSRRGSRLGIKRSAKRS